MPSVQNLTMKKYLTLFCGTFLLFLSGCGGSSDSTTVDAAGKHNEELLENTGKSEKAGWFVAEVASTNLFLQELGRLASSKASTPPLKQFGQLIFDHHSQLNTQLKQIADLKNLMTPTSMSGDHQDRFTALLEKSGQEFDKAFVEEMVQEHENAVERYQEFIEEGTDTELKNYASQGLPTLRAHLEQANTLQDQIK